MANFFTTKKGKDTLNVIFSVGAAVVIFGALAKIEHWGGPLSHALEVGMLVETVVFLLMALIPAEKEYHWDRFFPNITMSPEEEKSRTGRFEMTPFALGGSQGNPALQKMDRMLEEADITPANLQKLSDNFQRLGNTVDKMSEISDVVAATGDYTQRTREATVALSSMKEAYEAAGSAVQSFNNASGSAQTFHEQLQTMTQNLASLNAIYELELQDTNNHLKVMNKFYSSLAEASERMTVGAEDARKTQEQIAVLARNLSSLNAIYGNMLSAMQGSR
ncbi:gliding motility protein GldL [Compostibacter hankyongensis]|uniref:Gliding motility protein GldL-like N-terminal domain-containing protein n=1 Tax=Compostibacter hankyongensis TaxID=1007089 RepID=A0ABP8FDG3_9BACT